MEQELNRWVGHALVVPKWFSSFIIHIHFIHIRPARVQFREITNSSPNNQSREQLKGEPVKATRQLQSQSPSLSSSTKCTNFKLSPICPPRENSSTTFLKQHHWANLVKCSPVVLGQIIKQHHLPYFGCLTILFKCSRFDSQLIHRLTGWQFFPECCEARGPQGFWGPPPTFVLSSKNLNIRCYILEHILKAKSQKTGSGRSCFFACYDKTNVLRYSRKVKNIQIIRNPGEPLVSSISHASKYLKL